MIESGVTILFQDKSLNNRLRFHVNHLERIVDMEAVASSNGRAKPVALNTSKLSYNIYCDDIALYFYVASFEVAPMWISIIKGWN
jgi:hypothetical protein